MNKMRLVIMVALLVSVFTSTVAGSTNAFIRNSIKDNSITVSDSELSASWREIFNAFLDGTNIEEHIDNSTECVHNIITGYDDLLEAINHISYRGWDWDNYLDLVGALGDVTPIVRVCYDVSTESVEDVKVYFSSFDDFVDFVIQAKDNAVGHLFDWYEIYDKINEAIKRGKEKDIAFQIGRAVTLLFNFTPKMNDKINENSEVSLPDLEPLEEFLEGFLNGTQVLSSDNIKECVNETQFMVQSVHDANEKFKEQTEEGFKQGVFEIADMFARLRDLNEDCYYGVGDIEDIIMKYYDSFTSP